MTFYKFNQFYLITSNNDKQIKYFHYKSFIFISLKKNNYIFIFRTNVVMNYTETEAKVREATNDDAWGPTGN